MGTEPAKEIYEHRAATSECVNAIARNRGLRPFLVSGLTKARAILLWFALAHNLIAGRRPPAGPSAGGMSARAAFRGRRAGRTSPLAKSRAPSVILCALCASVASFP
jgi:hypothetical protein